ncbi:MAG: ParB/RepB/Spo0J family partition protein [Lachnospiraceae bacterium]|nr:ParB/RepB/Spo0J family partition protein [Lachnospiraceae bacterium]
MARGLGKGLDALIPRESINLATLNSATGEGLEHNDQVLMVKISKIEPDRNQPRKNFSEDELNELADSIKSHGIFQPLLVQKKERYYEIVAGERRWRAAKIVGLTEVPVIVREFSDKEKVEVQLLENLQRETLNPIEEANAYKRLLTEFGMKQDELAESIGKNRTTITNTMRLLNLDERVQEMVVDEKITQGHARALLGIEKGDRQFELANKVFDEQLNVRDTEKLVKAEGKPKKIKKQTSEALDLILRKFEDEIRSGLGAKISIKAKDNNKGKIEIDYYSQVELENLVKLLSSAKDKQ